MKIEETVDLVMSKVTEVLVGMGIDSQIERGHLAQHAPDPENLDKACLIMQFETSNHIPISPAICRFLSMHGDLAIADSIDGKRNYRAVIQSRFELHDGGSNGMPFVNITGKVTDSGELLNTKTNRDPK